MNRQRREKQSGFSMIELAVATAVFSMGLGSLSLMMLASVQGTAEASHRTAATTQAYSLAELIAMQSDAFGHFIDPPGAAPPACDQDFCPDEAIAATSIQSWQNHLAGEVPGANGVVCRDSTPDDGDTSDPSCDGSGALVIKIFWTELRHENAEDGGHRRVVSRLAW
jgi:type IV pilus assembly protein PilV